MENNQAKEEYAIVLDFLPNGYALDKRPVHQKSAVAQAIGTSNFTLLEVVPKKGVFLQPYDKVYIGSGKREEIHHISGKIATSKLTSSASKELEFVVKEIIDKNETRFIEFFNKAVPLSTRMHQLELLPGVGKKHMWQIIDERDTEDFKSFEDIKNRVKLLPNPKKSILRRIMAEIQGDEKYNLFVDTAK